MKYLRFLIVLFTTVFVVNVNAHNNKPLKLYVGAVELYKLSDVERVVVGNGSVLSAKVVDHKGVLLIANQAGQSDVQLWQNSGNVVKLSVVVTPDNAMRTASKVKKMLSFYPSLTVIESEGLIIVQGEADEKQKEQLETIFTTADNVVSVVKYRQFAAGIQPMVRMQVKVVEFKKSRLNNIGVQWDTSMAGPAFATAKGFTNNPIFSVASPGQFVDDISAALTENIGALDSRSWSHFGIVTGISSKIQLLAEKGDVRMLAEPNLSTRSGESASFLAGGEFPIPTQNGLGSTDVEFKEYGIKLDIEPVVDSDDNIISRVAAEVSSIDPSTAVLGVPGLLTRKTESVINAKSNETIVISGLVNQETSKSISRFPFLGDIPILGELFKSRNFREAKTELVIFVTPTLVYPGEESHQKQLANGEKMVEEATQLEAFYILD